MTTNTKSAIRDFGNNLSLFYLNQIHLKQKDFDIVLSNLNKLDGDFGFVLGLAKEMMAEVEKQPLGVKQSLILSSFQLFVKEFEAESVTIYEDPPQTGDNLTALFQEAVAVSLELADAKDKFNWLDGMFGGLLTHCDKMSDLLPRSFPPVESYFKFVAGI